MVLFETESQVYGTASKENALEHPPPEGSSLEEKHILFVSYEPDRETLTVREIPREEVLTAQIKEKPPRKKKETTNDEA